MRARKASSLATVVATVSLGVCALSAAPAYAATPTNDTIGTATEITTVPFTDTVDTTDATTDAVETSLNADCGAPAVEHGVWYHATVVESGNYTADVSQSSFSAGIMVVAGPADAPTLLLCGPGSVTGPLSAGQDVFLLVIGDGSSSETSGTMVLNVAPAAPAPTVNLTINSRGSCAHDGSVALSGTISCTGGEVDFAGLFGSVQQSVGRFTLNGFFDAYPDVVCDGTTSVWRGTATGDNGRFGGGHANVDVQAEVCSQGSCGFAEATATVQLSGRGR